MSFPGLGRGLKSSPAPWSQIRAQPRQFLDIKQYLPRDGEGYWGLEDPSKMSAAAVQACLKHWLDRQSNGEIPLEFSHFLTFDGRLVVANPLSAAPLAGSTGDKPNRSPTKRGKKKHSEVHNTDYSEGDEADEPKLRKRRKGKKQQKEKKRSHSSDSSPVHRAEKRPRQTQSEEDVIPRPRPNASDDQSDAQASALSRQHTPLFLRSASDSEEELSLLSRERRRKQKAPRHPSPYEEHVDSFDYSSLDPELLAISKAMEDSRKLAVVGNPTPHGESSSVPGIAGPSNVLPTGPISELQVPALLAKYPSATRAKALKFGFTHSLIAQNPGLLNLIHNIVEATPSTIFTPQQPAKRGRAPTQKDIGSPSPGQAADKPTSETAAAGNNRRGGPAGADIEPPANQAAAAELEDARLQLAAAAAEIKKLTATVASRGTHAKAIGKVHLTFDRRKII